MVQMLNWHKLIRSTFALCIILAFQNFGICESLSTNTNSFFNNLVERFESKIYQSTFTNPQIISNYPKEIVTSIKNFRGENEGVAVAMPSPCPDIEIIDLRNVPGYPQINDLSVCGQADTLSMMIFTGDPGVIKGLEFEIDFPDGIEYAGWEFAQLGNTSISIIDPRPDRPTFLVDGVTGDSLVIVNIGVRSKCDVDKTKSLYFDYQWKYTFIDTAGLVHKCKGAYTPPLEFNGAVHIPVLNMLDPLIPESVNITALETPFCQTIEVSQDGLMTYVDSIRFEINNLELFGGDLILDTIYINSIGYPLSNLDYDPVIEQTRFLIDGSYFPSNQGGSPVDNRFNTNELLEIEICYRVDECPTAGDHPFNYNLYYGCDDVVCLNSGQTSFLSIRPTGALFATATSSLGAEGIEICGMPGQISIELNNPNTPSKQTDYTDVKIGFQTCDKPNLDVTGVLVGGVTLPDSAFQWFGDDINIDLTGNVNPNIGLQDTDGDGFYDDLEGGNSISAVVEISIDCGVTANECAPMSCDDIQFYVDYITNCNVPYKQFPAPENFDIRYAADTVYNPTEIALNTAGTTFGYDFGKVSNEGAPIAGTGPDTVEVEFCYEFDVFNISDCPSGPTDYLHVDFVGMPVHILDLQYVAGSAMVSTDGGTTYAAAASESWTKSSDTDAHLVIEQASTSNNVCYKYSMEMDSCICIPEQYFAGNQQVVSVCSDCTPDCEIVKACRSTLFAVDPDCSPCKCILDHGVAKSERRNLGYTDKTMTTKHTRESLVDAGAAIDLGRFVPGDTLLHEEFYVITCPSVLENTAYWHLTWYTYPVGLSVTEVARLPMVVDYTSARFLEYSVSKPGGAGARTDIDVGSFQSCNNSNSPPYQGYRNYWNSDPWNTFNKFTSRNSAPDYWDNNRTDVLFFNYDDIDDCGGSEGFRAEGNCLNDMIDTYSLEVGDTLWYKWDAPLIKNPLREAMKSLGTEPDLQQTARIISFFRVYQIDSIAGNGTHCASYVGLSCREELPLFFDCPGGPEARTEMDLTDCGGTVKHEFYLTDFPGEIGEPWYTEEYRPYIDLRDVKGLVRAPLAYCGGAEVERFGTTYPVVSDSAWNMFCAPVDGYTDEVCAVESGDSARIVFDLFEQGIPALGYGNGNCDTISLSYNLCMICPAPINNVLEYDLLYDWRFVGGHNYSEDNDYLCNQIHSTNPAPYLDASICDELGLTANGANWFDLMMFYDTLMGSNDVSSPTFVLNDMRNPLSPVGVTNLGPNFLASDAPGVSIEIQPVSLCNSDAAQVATGVGANVKVPNSIRFEDAYTDVDGTMALTSTLISDDGTYKIYSIMLPVDTLNPLACDTIYVGTTLLFCPDPTDTAPNVCVGGFSGCAPEEIKAALSASGGCGGSEICYTYVFGEVGLQTEWFDMPAPFPLCDTAEFKFLVKNVKQLMLLDLEPMVELLNGMVPIPGSWQVAYPGGPTTFGSWDSIPDPDVVSGNTYAYSDDALWNDYIHLNGFQGVSSSNVTADSNKFAIRFKVTTMCDEFLSGGKLYTETFSTDPCSDENVSTGFVESPSVTLAEANPADYAQLLTISEPDRILCEGLENTFGITVINSGNKSTSDSVRMCITLPQEVTYTPMSIMYASPSNYVHGGETITTIGTNTEVCFDAPVLGPYGTYSINFDAVMDPAAMCGSIRIGTDIKSVVDMVTCNPGPPDECAAFVQNSLNSFVNVDLKPPFAADDLEVFTDCSTNADMVNLYYEYNINHSGANATNQSYTINFYEDIDGSQTVNPNVDALLGSDSGIFSVNNGAAVQVSGSVEVPFGKSCPVLFEVVYDTDCECEREEAYFDDISYRALRGYDEPITMCPGSCIDIEVCDFVSVEGDSIKGATGVVYELENTGKHSTLPTGGGFATYNSLTNNSILSPDSNYISNRQLTQNFYLVAHYPCPVNVESIFIGGGQLTGWTHDLQVYTSVRYQLEYSQDGTTWFDSGLIFTGPNGNFVQQEILPTPIAAQHWRITGLTTGWWTTSEFRLEGEPLEFQSMAPITQTGNMVTICIPDSTGIDMPWQVTFTTGTGECEVEEILEIWGIDTPGITVEGDTVACQNQCVDLELVVPNDATAGMTVSWSPASLINDPTAFRIEACSLSANTVFQATVTYNDGACVDVIDWPVTFLPENDINLWDTDLDCYNVLNPPVVYGDDGWDVYTWFEVTPSGSFIAFSSTENTFVPMPGVTYYLQATQAGTLCPAVSETFTAPNNPCPIDLGDLPDSALGTGTATNYETLLANNGPSHVIISGLHLGPNVDQEQDGQPTGNALGDGADENGIVINPSMVFTVGRTFVLPLSITNLTGSPSHFEAWIDWNGDGDFNDPQEMVADLTDGSSAYPSQLLINIPQFTTPNSVVGFRLRLSNTDNMTPYGHIDEGEIEDYLIGIECKQVCLPLEIETNDD